MTPVLKRLYKDAPTEVREKTIKRYLEFFNTHATLAQLLFGLLAALEVSTPEDEKNSITSIKTGLMGPIAGLGDGMFWLLYGQSVQVLEPQWQFQEIYLALYSHLWYLM